MKITGNYVTVSSLVKLKLNNYETVLFKSKPFLTFLDLGVPVARGTWATGGARVVHDEGRRDRMVAASRVAAAFRGVVGFGGSLRLHVGHTRYGGAVPVPHCLNGGLHGEMQG